MVWQRRGRLTNIKSTLVQRLLIAEPCLYKHAVINDVHVLHVLVSVYNLSRDLSVTDILYPTRK